MAAHIVRRGRRGKGRRLGRIAEINVTPFVDVMLVLLIVFMITAPLLTVGVPVELPKTEAKQLAADETPLTITVRRDGAVFLQDSQVDDSLLPKLKALAQEGLQSRIFIRGDDAANYGTVAKVMAKINAAGYRNIGLVTDTLDDAEKKS
jgi:biopolymer transport protein TolR